jgi:glycosyltransferase involved in cell wall biosynthesis
MKIAFFSHSSSLGGAERCLIELVQQLISDFGCSCLVIAPSGGPLVDMVSESGAKTFIIQQPWWVYQGEPSEYQRKTSIKNRLATHFPVFLTGILPVVDDFNPDLIFTNTIVNPWGALIAGLINKPHIWSIHECVQLDHGMQFIDEFDVVVRDILRSSSKIITCSNSVKKALFHAYDLKEIITVYPSIDVGCPEESLNVFKKDGAVRLGVFGSVNESKGQLDVVKACEQLIAEGNNIELVIAGYKGSNYYNLIHEFIKEHSLEDHIILLDFQEDIFPVIKATDIVILSSRYEAFGRVGIEAALLDCALVYTNRAGPTEYHQDTITGLSYEYGDIGDLKDKLSQLINNPSKIKDLATNGRALVERRFPARNYAKSIMPLIMDPLERISKETPIPNQLFLSSISFIEALKSENEFFSKELGILKQDMQRSALLVKEKADKCQEIFDNLKAAEIANEAITKTLYIKNNQLSSLTSTIRHKNHEITLSKKQLSQLNQELKNLNNKIIDQNSRIDVVAQEHDRALSQILLKDNEIKFNAEIIQLRDFELENLKENLAKKNEELISLSDHYKDSNLKLSTIQGEVLGLQKLLTEKNLELDKSGEFSNYLEKKILKTTLSSRILDYANAIRSRLEIRHISIKNYIITASSIYFDKLFYINEYPDVLARRFDPVAHYLLHGGAKGRDPGPFFSSVKYLDHYKDVKEMNINPLLHYELHGRREGRNIFSR